MEQALITSTLCKVNGNRTHAAEMLGISIRTLRNKLQEYKERMRPDTRRGLGNNCLTASVIRLTLPMGDYENRALGEFKGPGQWYGPCIIFCQHSVKQNHRGAPMESPPLFKGTISILEKALDFRSRRHQAAVSNIANIDTPGYKAFDVVMDEEFQRSGGPGEVPVLTRTHAGHLSGSGTGRPENLTHTVKQSAVVAKADGNTVDLDRSMADLAENNLMYSALAQMVSKKFSFLRNAIQGGSQ